MLYAATIIEFDSKKKEKVYNAIAKYKNVEIFTADDEKGKMVITTEYEKDDELQAIEDALLKVDGIIDVMHHAFNFEEEVEKMQKGETKVNLDDFFKMRDDNKERK